MQAHHLFISMHSLLPSSLLPLLPYVLLPMLFLIPLLLIPKRNKLSKASTHKKANPQPPGNFGWPVLGETVELVRAGREGRPGSFLNERMSKYGSRVFTTSLFGEPTAVFCSAEGNKFLFGNENRKVTLSWPSSAVKLLGSCIITLGGDEGKVMRRMLMSVFRHEALARYTTIMDEVTQNHIKTHWEGKKEVVVYPTIKRCIFELTCQLFLSIRDPEAISNLSRPFSAFLEGVISVPVNIPGTRFYRARRAAGSIRKMIREIIRERRAGVDQKTTTMTTEIATQDLLSYLMVTADENGKLLTEDEIINNLLLLLVAAHDTTSCTITMVVKYLGDLPHVYDLVLAEQREIALQKKKAGGDERLTGEDIQRMRVSWSVVSEVMRLVPPVLGGFRVALQDLTFHGYDIPKGWKLMWSPLTTNNDSAVFPSATDFDPHRFERSSPPAPCAFVPFGGGPRICLGKDYAQLQILIFLHHLVNTCAWSSSIPNEKIRFDPMPIPSHGLPISLQPHCHRDI